jgi:hypothetical protein
LLQDLVVFIALTDLETSRLAGIGEELGLRTDDELVGVDDGAIFKAYRKIREFG